MRHRKLGRFNQTLHRCLRQGKFDFTLPVIEVREIRRWQGRQRKTATPGAYQHPFTFQLHGNFRAFRQTTADIKEFARRNGRRSWLVWLNQRNACHHFHLEISTGQRQRTVSNL